MIRLRSNRLAGDERGATVIEFALILVPLCIALLGFLDLGYRSYLRSVLQGGLNDVARKASVENPEFDSDAESLEERVHDALIEKMGGLAKNGSYEVEAKNYYDFAGVGKPERLTTDKNKNGNYDAGDCWQDTNANGSFDTDSGSTGIGGASDVVFYEVTLTTPRIVPIGSLLGVSDDMVLTAQTAIRSQPYADQREPEVKC